MCERILHLLTWGLTRNKVNNNDLMMAIILYFILFFKIIEMVIKKISDVTTRAHSLAKQKRKYRQTAASAKTFLQTPP